MIVTLTLEVTLWWVGTFLETIYISNLKASHALKIWTELHSNKSWVGKFRFNIHNVIFLCNWLGWMKQLVEKI